MNKQFILSVLGKNIEDEIKRAIRNLIRPICFLRLIIKIIISDDIIAKSTKCLKLSVSSLKFFKHELVLNY